MKKIFTLAVSLFLAVTASASLTLKAEGGWNESAWMEFTGLDSDYSCYSISLCKDILFCNIDKTIMYNLC